MVHIFKRAIRTDYQILKLEKWLNGKGLTLVKGKALSDEVFMDRKLVLLSTRPNLIHQLFSLAHECGHVMIRSDLENFNKEFPSLVKFENKEYDKFPLVFHMEEIKEEIKAWDNGLVLMRKLSIPINEKEYYKYAAKWVLRYCALATVDRKWLLD